MSWQLKAAAKQSLFGRPNTKKKILDPKYWSEALRLAMQVPPSQSRSEIPRRLHSVRLLTRSKVNNPEAVHSALIQTVLENNYDLIEHLIVIGAFPNFRGRRSVVTAASQSDIRSLELLARSKPTSEIYSRASTIISQDPSRWHQDPGLIHRLDRILIPGGAKGSAVDQVFPSALLSLHVITAEFVSMVLGCKTVLDVNFSGGKSLCVAVKSSP